MSAVGHERFVCGGKPTRKFRLSLRVCAIRSEIVPFPWVCDLVVELLGAVCVPDVAPTGGPDGVISRVVRGDSREGTGLRLNG